MKITPEMQAQYEECRLRKHALEKINDKLFWGHIIGGALLFGSAVFVTALAASNPEVHATSKWYYGFQSGVMQLLYGLLVIALTVVSGIGKRLGSLLLLALFTAVFIWTVGWHHERMMIFNMLSAAAGIAANIFWQRVFAQENELKQMPGYPSFRIGIDQPAGFVPSAVVTERAAAASDEMEALVLPGQEPAAVPEMQQPAAAQEPQMTLPNAPVLPPEVQLTEWQERPLFSDQTKIPEAAVSAAAAIQLDVIAETHAAAPEKPAGSGMPLPVLEEMDAHPAKPVGGDVSLLPDPETVRAQLAAMKAAKERRAGQQQPGSLS